MPDEKTVLKIKQSNSFAKVLMASSAELVSRQHKSETVEQSLTNLENDLNNMLDQTIKMYYDLPSLGLTAGSETIETIIGAMSDKSGVLIGVGSGYNSAQYPASNGTLYILKRSQEFAIAFFQQVNVNALYTGVYYKAVSGGAVTWTGWEQSGGGVDLQVSSTQPTDQKEGDLWAEPLS